MGLERRIRFVSARRGNFSERSLIHNKEENMPDSVYKIIEVVGTSKVSWEDAAKNAVMAAGKHLKDLRVAEIVKLDMAIEKNKIVAYRARVCLSFKYDEKSK